MQSSYEWRTCELGSKRKAKVAVELLECRRRLKQVMGVPVIFRVSIRGVPHLLVGHEGNQASVCWFASSRTFKIFYPYMTDNPRVKKYTGYKGVVRKLRKWKGKERCKRQNASR